MMSDRWVLWEKRTGWTRWHVIRETDDDPRHGPNLWMTTACGFERMWTGESRSLTQFSGVACQRCLRWFVRNRCEMVGCPVEGPHEHGGGQAMREMTPEERAAVPA